MIRLLQFTVLLVLLMQAPAWAAGARAKPLVPIPPTYGLVNDYHGVLTITQKLVLEDKLQRLENTNGTQIILLIVPTTEPETTEEYASRVMEAWGPGHNGEPTGILFTINASKPTYIISLGAAMQGVLPDVLMRRVWSEKIHPHWRKREWFKAVDAGIDAMISAARTETTPPPDWEKEIHTRLTPRGWALLGLILFGLTYSGYYLHKWYRAHKNREVKS